MWNRIYNAGIKLFKANQGKILPNYGKRCYDKGAKGKFNAVKGVDVMLRSEIKSKADEIRAKYGLNNPPIDVENLCARMGISVEYMDMAKVEKNLGHEISGAIISDGVNSHIKINCKDIPARQNFTIAHELGHKLLHIHDDPDGVIVSFRCLKNKREREADAFAAELLMPDSLVQKEYNKLFYPLVSQLAEIFHVSQSAMKYKLDELGLRYIG